MTVAALLATWGGAGTAARAADDVPVPAVTVQAFGGPAAGVGARLWFAQLLRADLSAGAALVGPFDWASWALIVRLAGTPRQFVALRTGYQVEYDGQVDSTWMGSRTAHAFDAGLVARIESARGSAVEAQAGVEEVFRSSAAICCDNAALPRTSTGVRVSLLGEVAVWNQLALYAQGELRTGAHIMEIGVLPMAVLGVRYRF
ncbi:MAG TPA: hypothetical protein VHM31_00925 [Polyangia bacterium]|nr:hypothetical protein [Polyangia bacterium]